MSLTILFIPIKLEHLGGCRIYRTKFPNHKKFEFIYFFFCCLHIYIKKNSESIRFPFCFSPSRSLQDDFVAGLLGFSNIEQVKKLFRRRSNKELLGSWVSFIPSGGFCAQDVPLVIHHFHCSRSLLLSDGYLPLQLL